MSLIYSQETVKSRLDTLFQTPRMYFIPLITEEHGHANTTNGLWDLVNEFIKEEDFVVEVGSFSGVSSRVIALRCKELHCVDPYYWGGVVSEGEKNFDAMLVDYPNIKKVKMPGVEAAKLYEDHSIDFVYIDADHSYEAVLQDIDSWIKKVKKGGFLAGHDSYMPDVIRAVEHRFGKDYKIYSDTSWVVKL